MPKSKILAEAAKKKTERYKSITGRSIGRGRPTDADRASFAALNDPRQTRLFGWVPPASSEQEQPETNTATASNLVSE